jgi:hypothetical protein
VIQSHRSFAALPLASHRIVSPPQLAEQTQLERILDEGRGHLEARILDTVAADGLAFPIHVLALGNPDRSVPAVGFFGGVHGLERIGTEVVLAYLHGLVQRLRWDTVLVRKLETVRLVFMPIVNPGGMWRGTRANPNGVDLMRNAPLESVERVPFLVGGQRIGAGLPWYRGPAEGPMEAKSQAVCTVVEQELLAREFSLAIDRHSGFGLNDRIWFPYAHTPLPMEHLAEVHALIEIFEEAYAHHSYLFEPQSRQYLTHGDLWDYLYLKAVAHPERIFLPMTLEMGSWLWVKKNPRQLFSRHGIFNPLIQHRLQRVLRRHLSWLEFLSRAASSYRRWLPAGEDRARRRDLAIQRWYLGGRR